MRLREGVDAISDRAETPLPRELGATKGELIRHATSGDVTGDYGSVVGYAGLVVS